jgi:hypothetical protein
MNEDQDQDQDLTLRDKLATAALPALIQRFTQKVESAWIKGSAPTKEFESDIDTIAVMAYKIADAMRKARLQSFT